jgi:hypothetical protein
MTKLYLLFAILSLTLTCNLKPKSEIKPINYTIEWEVYDSLGNVTYYRKTIDHKPSKEDTIDFRNQLDSSFKLTK